MRTAYKEKDVQVGLSDADGISDGTLAPVSSD